MNKITTIKIPLQIKLAFMFSLVLVFTGNGLHAAGQDQTTFLGSGVSLAYELYTYLRTTVYIAGAIGLLIMATLAFFGRFAWNKFLSILGGLFIAAMIDQLFTWITINNSDVNNGLNGAGLL